MERPLEPAEELMRQRIEREVRKEFSREEEDRRLEEVSRAKAALAITGFIAVCIGLPIVGLVVGAAVRLFRLASGF